MRVCLSVIATMYKQFGEGTIQKDMKIQKPVEIELYLQRV
jgi:hypothetical protein